VLPRLSFLLLLTTCLPSSVLANEDAPRVLFGGPVTYAEAWDDERLWVVSQGRLLALDLCDPRPRPVHLAESAGPSRRTRPPDVEKELMLAGLDEGAWDERLLEDFREDEGLGEEPRRRRADASRNESGAEPVRALARRGAALVVTKGRGEWLCVPAQAACRSQVRPVPATRPPDPPPLRDDLVRERDSPHGRWLMSAAGVWFAPREGLDLGRRCVELGRPFEPLPVAAVGRAPASSLGRWLPEVTLLGARRAVSASDGRRRADVLLMILLSFPGGAGSLFSPGELAEGVR